MPLQFLSVNVLVSLTSLSTVNSVVINSSAASPQSRAMTKLESRAGNLPLSSQGSGVVDVPGSHYSKPSELSSGSSTDPFFSFSTLAFGITLSAI